MSAIASQIEKLRTVDQTKLITRYSAAQRKRNPAAIDAAARDLDLSLNDIEGDAAALARHAECGSIDRAIDRDAELKRRNVEDAKHLAACRAALHTAVDTIDVGGGLLETIRTLKLIDLTLMGRAAYAALTEAEVAENNRRNATIAYQQKMQTKQNAKNEMRQIEKYRTRLFPITPA